MTIANTRLIALIVIATALAACVATKDGAYAEEAYGGFARSFSSLEGKPYEQAFNTKGWPFHGHSPTTIQPLENNNEVYAYLDYFNNCFETEHHDHRHCDISVTGDTKTQTVKSVHWVGDGCWLPY